MWKYAARRVECAGKSPGWLCDDISRSIHSIFSCVSRSTAALMKQSAEAAYALRKARAVYEDEMRGTFLPASTSTYLLRDVNDTPPSLEWQTNILRREQEAGVGDIASKTASLADSIHAAVTAFVVCELNADLFNEMVQYLYGSV